CEKILQTAITENVDIIGLSGLITPSLEEMCYVAQEMTRLEFKIPLLIGGATTSRKHTAVKIQPCYPHATLHVTDASLAVTVISQLLNEQHKHNYLKSIQQEYNIIRTRHNDNYSGKEKISIFEARKNKLKFDWGNYLIPKPKFLGNKFFLNYSLQQLVDY